MDSEGETAAMANAPAIGIRQSIAARTPAGPRKAVRMALNYAYRLRTWLDLLGELRPADSSSRAILWKSFLAAPLTAARKLDSFQKPVLLGDVVVDVAGVGRFALRAATDDVLHVMSSREPAVRHLLETELRPGATFVDGGANIGFYSLLAARLVGSEGHVVAFEMMPDTAEILRRHVNDNRASRVSIVAQALSDRAGELVAASVAPGQHGQASIVAQGGAGRVLVDVETTTLDQALAHLGTIDLLKLDLEGAEHLALRGAGSVLSRTNCVVFESNAEDARVFDLLSAGGFTIERLEGFDFVARKVGR